MIKTKHSFLIALAVLSIATVIAPRRTGRGGAICAHVNKRAVREKSEFNVTSTMPSDEEIDALIELPLETLEVALTRMLNKLNSRSKLALMEIILKKLNDQDPELSCSGPD